jgi:ureidoacrylate peracid hydrolase
MSSQLLETIDARLNPSHTAVLVIDMQNDFCAEGGYIEKVVGKDAAACRAVAKPIMDLVEKARAAGVPVYWIKANYDPDKLPAGMLTKQRERSTSVCCGTGSWGNEFFGVAPQGGETVIEKHSYSAFARTDLEQKLRDRGVRTLVFTGVQTNICVETSLRDAVCMGFYACLALDCVASHTQPLHDATVLNTRFLFGDTMTGNEVADIWGKAGEAAA